MAFPGTKLSQANQWLWENRTSSLLTPYPVFFQNTISGPSLVPNLKPVELIQTSKSKNSFLCPRSPHERVRPLPHVFLSPTQQWFFSHSSVCTFSWYMYVVCSFVNEFLVPSYLEGKVSHVEMRHASMTIILFTSSSERGKQINEHPDGQLGKGWL